MQEVTNLQEAKEWIMENEYRIQDLIKPEDLIYQDITSWDNVNIDALREEIGMGFDQWTYPNSHPYSETIRDLAIKWYVEDMIRIPFDHLVFEDREKCVIEGYWLYDISRNEVSELVYENIAEIEFFYEYEDNVRMEIESYILDARLRDLE